VEEIFEFRWRHDAVRPGIALDLSSLFQSTALKFLDNAACYRLMSDTRCVG
jgi:hypothetical protein